MFKTAKDQTGISIVVVIILIVVVAGVAVGAFYLGTKNTYQPSPTPSITYSPAATPASSPAASSSASPSVTPTINPAVLENIKASITSKNTAALEGYMAEQVNVLIEATECCGIVTKLAAIKELDYLKSATLPWNFDQSDPKIANIKQNYPQVFSKDSLIGIAANEYMVAFTLNSANKIEKIYLAATYKLLNNK